MQWRIKDMAAVRNLQEVGFGQAAGPLFSFWKLASSLGLTKPPESQRAKIQTKATDTLRENTNEFYSWMVASIALIALK